MMLSNCELCNSKKSRFIKEQEANGLLIKLEIKTNLTEISLVVNLLI